MDPPKLAECFAKMEHNLKLALEEDDRNQRENDAKLRAISQRTLTYEEFRDIVKAAHLKPVNKSDAERKKDLPQTRNSVASKNQEWRKLDIQQRSALLYDLGPSGLIERIGVSISTTLLKEIFEVLIQADEQRLIQTVQLLQALTRVERFAIIVCFLNSEESTACRRLFQKLSADYIQQKKDSAKLVKLKELYLVL